MEKLVKLSLAVLLIICLFDMPYGFYQFIRFIAMIGFGVLAFQANEEKKRNESFIYIGLAILFQPLLKISLGRELWNAVDFIVAAGLLVTVFRK